MLVNLNKGEYMNNHKGFNATGGGEYSEADAMLVDWIADALNDADLDVRTREVLAGMVGHDCSVSEVSALIGVNSDHWIK